MSQIYALNPLFLQIRVRFIRFMRNKITRAVPPNPVAMSNLSGKLTNVSRRALFFHQMIKSHANQFADNSTTKQAPSAWKAVQILNLIV